MKIPFSPVAVQVLPAELLQASAPVVWQLVSAQASAVYSAPVFLMVLEPDFLWPALEPVLPEAVHLDAVPAV